MNILSFSWPIDTQVLSTMRGVLPATVLMSPLALCHREPFNVTNI
jgi:hypothetical protein